jgi:hypothetical protein
MQIKGEAQFDQAVAKLESDGKVTNEQAITVEAQWRKRYGKMARQ